MWYHLNVAIWVVSEEVSKGIKREELCLYTITSNVTYMTRFQLEQSEIIFLCMNRGHFSQNSLYFKIALLSILLLWFQVTVASK